MLGTNPPLVMGEKSQKNRSKRKSACSGNGAPEGTRTHTLKAREPKSRMSTNSITGAYKRRVVRTAVFSEVIRFEVAFDNLTE